MPCSKIDRAFLTVKRPIGYVRELVPEGMTEPPSRARPLPRSATNGRNGGADGVPTLKRVHAAARARFAERGYGAASMRQIASDAGITVGTLFFHWL